MSTVLKRYGSIDILVNNAGTVWGASAVTHSPEAWRKVMGLNVDACFFIAREVAQRWSAGTGIGFSHFAGDRPNARTTATKGTKSSGWSPADAMLPDRNHSIHASETSRVFETVEGLRISALVTRGAKTPVLLIHGNSTSGEVFAGQVAALRELGHPAITHDLSGHDRSEDAKDPGSTYSFPGYARILRLLLGRLGILRYHIVGWSLGGHIGIKLWHADPAALRQVKQKPSMPPRSLHPSSAERRRSGEQERKDSPSGSRELACETVPAIGIAAIKQFELRCIGGRTQGIAGLEHEGHGAR